MMQSVLLNLLTGKMADAILEAKQGEETEVVETNA